MHLACTGAKVVVLIADNHASKMAVRMAKALLRPHDELQLLTVVLSADSLHYGSSLLEPYLQQQQPQPQPQQQQQQQQQQPSEQQAAARASPSGSGGSPLVTPVVRGVLVPAGQAACCCCQRPQAHHNASHHTLQHGSSATRVCTRSGCTQAISTPPHRTLRRVLLHTRTHAHTQTQVLVKGDGRLGDVIHTYAATMGVDLLVVGSQNLCVDGACARACCSFVSCCLHDCMQGLVRGLQQSLHHPAWCSCSCKAAPS
jgi:nucleotide-binding universal stress UspA family protein